MTVYELSDRDKEKLREPRGEVFEGDKVVEELEKRDYGKVIAVGDRVSGDLEGSAVRPDLSIVDGSIQRRELKVEERTSIDSERAFKVENPAGGITEEAWTAVRKASSLRCRTKLEVNGEEDLLALPALLFAPEDSVIVYGLWDQGAVLMEPSEENRSFAEEILDFQSSSHLIVGGSWDRLHAGHRYLLLTALEKAEKVDIGVTSDEMFREKIGEKPENSFEERKKRISNFLEGLDARESARLLEINDIYGNAVEEGDKLLVTPETLENGRKINLKRQELGRESLALEVVKKLKAEDGDIISSSRIRNEEIDREGLTL
ncbi:MAG: pantetheine-phosphate adenylyltransferase [Candidatus Nanohalobium sp.]